jgi:hypothetical protein
MLAGQGSGRWQMRALVVLLVLMTGLASPAWSAPIYADVTVVVDESGSMAGEHAWIGGTIVGLQSQLAGAGLVQNRYGLVGFGSASVLPRQLNVGGAQFGDAAQFNAATAGLLTNGGTEDGWAGITFALAYAHRADAARNIILISDEDRDNAGGIYAGLTFNSVLSSLTAGAFLLNAVVDATWQCGGSTAVLGVDSKGTAYVANGAGGYTTCTTGYSLFSDFGTTDADYVRLALATGGAAWNLNLLRAGGLTAQSFTEAFTDIKVQEIIVQPTVPEPGTLALLGVGLLVALRRRTRA